MTTKFAYLHLPLLGICLALTMLNVHGETVVWDRQAFGQILNTCIGQIQWPNDNNWGQDLDEECCDINCDNGSYVAQPSNWSTTTHPDSPTVDVILGDMGAPGTNLNKADCCFTNPQVHSLTILPVGSLNIEAGGGITVNSLIDLQTGTGDRVLTSIGGGGFFGYITLPAGSTMLKSTGTGAYTLQDIWLTATNATFQVNAGTLVFALDPGNSLTNCNFTLSTGAVLDLGSDPARPEHVNGTFVGSGGGALKLSGGLLQPSSNTVFNMPGNMFQWTGGYIYSSPSQTFTNAGKITIAGPVGLSGGFGGGFTNNKTIVQSGAGTLNIPAGTELTNAGVATYEIRNDLGMTNAGSSGGGASVFNNIGLFRKSSGAGVSDLVGDGSLYFNHLGGTVQVDTGTIRFGAGTSTGGNFVVATGAAAELAGNAVYGGTYTGSGGGNVRLTQGSVTPDVTATFNFPENMLQWSGSVVVNLQSRQLYNQGFITMTGTASIFNGNITNNGTIKGTGLIYGNGQPWGVTNNGTIAPGNPIGELDCDFMVMSSTSNLAFEIGGTQQGVTYDYLNFTSWPQITLGGTLAVSLANGFVPQPADTFTIMNSGIAFAGAFTNVANGQRLNTTDGAGSFVVSYGSAKLNDDATAANQVVLSDFQTNASVTVSPTRIREGQSATYTVSLGAAATQNTKVNFAMSGTATLGTDYTLSGAQVSGNRGKVTIPRGQSSATVTLSAINDGVTEGSETAIMTLSSGSGYGVGNPKKATVRISDP